MTKVKNAIALLGLSVVVAGSSTAVSVARTESFDKPIRKTVVNLGRSRYPMPNNPARILRVVGGDCSIPKDGISKEL